MNDVSRVFLQARVKVARLLFAGLLVWPLIHAFGSKVLGFSSWRLFGWGMYAQPHPESFSHLYLVWLNDSPNDVQLAYEDFERRWKSAGATSCLTVLLQEPGGSLREALIDDVCDDPAIDLHHRTFMHFRSLRHLSFLSQHLAPLLETRNAPPHLLAIHIQQRVSLETSTATTQSELFEIRNDNVISLGRPQHLGASPSVQKP